VHVVTSKLLNHLLSEMGLFTRDVNVLIFLDFSFRYDSVHQKY